MYANIVFDNTLCQLFAQLTISQSEIILKEFIPVVTITYFSVIIHWRW